MGCLTGAATAIVLMAESFGSDARLIAFMQYLRVVLVATTASLVVMFTADIETVAPAAVEWFPAINWHTLGPTLALIVCGAFLGELSRIPTGAMLVPLALGAMLQDLGLMVIDLPPWLLAGSYIFIGWRIGLGFTRAIIAHAARAFPAILGSTLILIAVCGLFGMALGHVLGLDPSPLISPPAPAVQIPWPLLQHQAMSICHSSSPCKPAAFSSFFLQARQLPASSLHALRSVKIKTRLSPGFSITDRSAYLPWKPRIAPMILS